MAAWHLAEAKGWRGKLAVVADQRNEVVGADRPMSFKEAISTPIPGWDPDLDEFIGQKDLPPAPPPIDLSLDEDEN